MSARADRRTVLTWLVTFLGIQGSLAILLDGKLDWLRNPDYVARREGLRARRREAAGRPVVAVLGTSRTMNGLNAALLEAGPTDRPLVFNFGLPGHGAMHLAVALDRLLDDGVRPDGLVVEVAPPLLAWDLKANDNVPTVWYSWRDLDGVADLKGGRRQLVADWLSARSVPTFGYRFNLMDRLLPAWQCRSARYAYWWRGLDAWGHVPIAGNRPSPVAGAQLEALFGAGLRDYRVADVHRRGMDRLLRRCARERLPVVLLLMPEGPLLRGMYPPVARERLRAWLAELHRDYRLRTIDATGWLASEEHFRDSHHLLPSGAEAFTRRFAEEVLPLFRDGGRAAVVSR